MLEKHAHKDHRCNVRCLSTHVKNMCTTAEHLPLMDESMLGMRKCIGDYEEMIAITGKSKLWHKGSLIYVHGEYGTCTIFFFFLTPVTAWTLHVVGQQFDHQHRTAMSAFEMWAGLCKITQDAVMEQLPSASQASRHAPNSPRFSDDHDKRRGTGVQVLLFPDHRPMLCMQFENKRATHPHHTLRNCHGNTSLRLTPSSRPASA